jgi:signal transduction histidine kinase
MKKLRRSRLMFAATTALLTFLVAAPLIYALVRSQVSRIDQRSIEDAEGSINWVLRDQVGFGAPPEAFVWKVWADGGSQALSDTNIQPPLIQLFEQGEGINTYRPPNGPTFLTLTQYINDNEAWVTLNDLTSYRADQRRWRIGGLAAVVTLTALGFGVGWLVSRKLLDPVRQAVTNQQGFLADAAHELRTPLAVILASASQALTRGRSSEEYVRSLSEIRSAAERASSGVNELLDLARFESGQAIPRLAPLRLDLLAEEVAASVRVDDSKIEATASDAVVVNADMALLRQAVDNVVRNAARRAPTVSLSTRSDERDGMLEVIDDGPGFDPAVLPHVFDRYRRGDRQGTVGMGLAIVQAVLAAHGGTAEVENRPEGGAIVRLRVPLTR